MFKKIFVYTLLVTLLFPTFSEVEAKSTNKDLANLLMVPLDDRPANLYFPQQVGKTAGVNVVTPPKEMLGYFTTPGDGQQISEWLLKHAEDADGFVISTSMLAYGGLIASRTGVKSLEDAMLNIEVIKQLKEKYPEKPLYVYDTIQRLAVTAISDEYLQYYSQIQSWAILYDQVHNLGMEEHREDLEELERIIPAEVLEDYKAARARNHEVNKTLIDWVDEGHIDYLILAQDDAAPHGLHRAEREVLVEKAESLHVNDQVSVFPGADEVDVVLVSRFVTNLFNTSSKIHITYGGVHGSEWIAPYEDTTFDINVEKHILAAGSVITNNPSEADIHLVLNTPQKDHDRQAEIDKLIGKIQSLIDEGKKVAIGDVRLVNRADGPFVTRLAEQIDLTKVHAYSGWNTAGNALGITLGHAIARDSFVTQEAGFGVPLYEKTAKAHYEFLLHRFAKDQGYKNVVHSAANAYAASLGASPWNLGTYYDVVNDFVIENLTAETEKWYNHFDGKQVYIGTRGEKDFYRTIDRLVDVHVQLPWPRTFEAELEPTLHLK
ncbi:DUF4127 family protein [Salirhabdus salicampi]|uniref:DUF4127 family protein n=1 Tax=Salirhabdus salicampi TaxID=476102 RepID=UPI0020C1F660|nr:DUF4127 family protein [Salirhabdus salicampi]MCP8615911.1 DUF4127 family protein [Salirhabdus salicampi]